VSITVSPNPVSENAALSIGGCDSSTPFRWRWDQIVENNTSNSVTFTQRINIFNGIQASAPNITVTVAAGQRTTHTTNWCSGTDGEHTFRTDWVMSTGTTVTGPNVRLLRR
jgi:hypothetical protein